MELEVRDSNGTTLADGDTVTVIKDLKVKGSSMVVKRGKVVKGIRLTDDPEHAKGGGGCLLGLKKPPSPAKS